MFHGPAAAQVNFILPRAHSVRSRDGGTCV